jgi:hypothetical protein
VAKMLRTIRKSSLLPAPSGRGLMSIPGGEGEGMWCQERTAATMCRSSSPRRCSRSPLPTASTTGVEGLAFSFINKKLLPSKERL